MIIVWPQAYEYYCRVFPWWGSSDQTLCSTPAILIHSGLVLGSIGITIIKFYYIALYPSTMDQITFCSWHLSCDTSLMFETSSICSLSGSTTVHVSHDIDMQLLLTGPTTSNFGMSATCYNNIILCISGVLMLLLLLAGDVETNPGPSGKFLKVFVGCHL
jgi:hypothetical protein